MHKINKILNELVDELWSIKHYDVEIELSEMVSFYNSYHGVNFDNMAIVGINAVVIARNADNIPITDEEVDAIVESLKKHHGYGYDTFVIDTLYELCCKNHKKSYEYLLQILDSDEKLQKFDNQFWDFKEFRDNIKNMKK